MIVGGMGFVVLLCFIFVCYIYDNHVGGASVINGDANIDDNLSDNDFVVVVVVMIVLCYCGILFYFMFCFAI